MEEAYRKVYSYHLKRVALGRTDMPKRLVVFSATPGSGKTELSTRLAAEYGFTRIANKDIRLAIVESGCSDKVSVGEYTGWFLDILAAKGSLSLVFDRNIDQWYQPARDWALQNHYRFIVVNIEVSQEIIRERLLHREGSSDAAVFGMLDFYNERHLVMSRIIDPDIVLADNYDLDHAAHFISQFAS